MPSLTARGTLCLVAELPKLFVVRLRTKLVWAGELNLSGRRRAAWQGKRNLGHRLLEVAVLGYDDFRQARAALSKTAATVVLTEKATD